MCNIIWVLKYVRWRLSFEVKGMSVLFFIVIYLEVFFTPGDCEK